MDTVPVADVQRAVWALRAYDAIALATAGEDGPRVAGVFFAPEERDSGIVLILAVTLVLVMATQPPSVL